MSSENTTDSHYWFRVVALQVPVHYGSAVLLVLHYRKVLVGFEKYEHSTPVELDSSVPDIFGKNDVKFL